MVLPPRTTRSSVTPKSPPPASSTAARDGQPTTAKARTTTTTAGTRLSTTTTATTSSRLGWNSSTTSSSSASSSAAPKARVTTTRPSTAASASSSAPPRALASSVRADSLAGSTTKSASAAPPTSRKPSLAASGGASRMAGGGALAPPSGLAAKRGVNAPVGRHSAISQGEMLPPATPSRRQTVDRAALDGYDSTKEPIKAFLRIKPPTDALQSTPSDNYLQVLSESEVLMTPPADHRLGPSASSMFLSSASLSLPSSSDPSSVPSTPTLGTNGTLYKFTSVAPSTHSALPDAQAAFYRDTTLPLVKSFLRGENCLLFAYGTTGSGKTWTVQGGQKAGEEGLLPRVLETVWRSLQQAKGVKGQASKLASLSTPPMQSTPKQGAQSLGVRGAQNGDAGQGSSDAELVPIDEGFDYSVSVSYAEIYNEKIYDLLEGPNPTITPSSSSAASTGASSMFGGISRLVRNFSTVKRSALSLKQDKTGLPGTKYVAGMQERPVSSAAEARAVLEKGQMNRRVYSTLANRASSRSHSVFTIKLNKTPKGLKEEEREKYTQVSRFSIVDLAGSERVVNTQTTGERLKEAGNINKSLMVLGQCMEVLRKNQEREKGKKAAIVPFRHSKLTELFQSFFVGDGQAVMIVNVDPFNTSFDENNHVMKFSAVAKGVMTVKNNVPVPVTPAPKIKPEPKVVRLSMIEGGEEEDVVYEEVDEEYDEEEEEWDEPEDEFVNALLDELSAMRTALFESQMQTVLAVSAAKQGLIAEYEQKMAEMERAHATKLREEADEAEARFDAKLDILRRMEETNKAAEARRPRASEASSYDDSDEEQEDEEDEEEEEETGEESFAQSERSMDPSEEEVSRMLSPQKAELLNGNSPLAHKLANMKLAQKEEEEEEEEEEGEQTETDAEQSNQSIDIDVDLSSSAADADESIALEADEVNLEDDDDDAPSSSARSSTRTPRASEATNADEEDEDELILAEPTKSAKKVKRKLGGNKVRELEEIEQAALQSPLGKKR